jgi:hypothetical protein
MKRLKPYSSNQRIALFKNYCKAQGLRPRKFGLDMDVRWNSTYLMLKHLLPYKEVFHVFITSNYGSTLLTAQHWYVAEQIMIFLELFYNSTIVLSGVYYPTAPLVLHHMLDMAEHLQNAERDANFRMIATPIKLKFLKYWEKIPLIYSYVFILDLRAKMKGFFNVLELLAKATGCTCVYYADVKDELYKLFAKYEQKFGAVRSQRVLIPSAHTGKIKQACGRIFGGPGESSVSSPHLHLLHLLLVSSKLTWTVTLSHVMRNPLTYSFGGVTTSQPIQSYRLWLEILCLSLCLLSLRSPVSAVHPGYSKIGGDACCLSMLRCSPASRTRNKVQEGNSIHMRTWNWRRQDREFVT